jgi:hypothetical protein
VKNILKPYEQEVLEQVEAGLRQSDADLQPLTHYSERRLALFWRGYRVMREQAKSIFGTPPAYLWTSFSPEDAGVGYSMQRAIYHSLGGQAYSEGMGALGALFNAIIGLIDKFTDDFTDFLPAVQEALNGRTLNMLLQLEGFTPLPRPVLDGHTNTEAAARLDLLLKLIEAYVGRARALAIQGSRQEVWGDFRTIYFELMRHQFASAALVKRGCEASAAALATAMGRTAPTMWAYFVNAWLARDTCDVERRSLYRAPVDAWGQAIVLSEDLCDLLVDLSDGRWNSVTLLAALEFQVPLAPAHIQEDPEGALVRLLEAHVPERVAIRMCDCYRHAFTQFGVLAPGRFDALEELGSDVLCYPLFAPQMARPERVQELGEKAQ